MSITLTIGPSGKVRNCLFDDTDHSTKASDLTLAADAEFTDSQWLAGNASSTITLGAGAVINGSSLEVDNSLVLSGAKAVIRGSVLTFAAAGDALLSGKGAKIVDSFVSTAQTSGTEAILLSGANTQIDVTADIQASQTTDTYDVVRVTGDYARIRLSLTSAGARKWRYAVTVDATADGTHIGHVAVDEAAILSSGVVSDSGTGTFTETVFPTAVTIDQPSTTAALPVLTLEQADIDEDFFKFVGTSDTSADRALVDAVDFSTIGALKGYLKINIQDDQATNPIVDGDYYLPFYAAPTA